MPSPFNVKIDRFFFSLYRDELVSDYANIKVNIYSDMSAYGFIAATF